MSEARSVADPEFFVNGPYMVCNRIFTYEKLLRYPGIAQALAHKKDNVRLTFGESEFSQMLRYMQFGDY